MSLASAVIKAPEPEEAPSVRRRQSSISSNPSKRLRLDTQSSHFPSNEVSPPSVISLPRKTPSAVGSGAAEERKRGQRLFGALLGTLSQSSSKPAHRRRDEVEKKQLNKVRQREEEVVVEERKKKEKLDSARREEQKIWDEQSMHLQHNNIRALARFLKTKAEPPLYYRPWDLLPGEEDQIRQQTETVEKIIDEDLAEHGQRKRDRSRPKEVHDPEHPLQQDGAENYQPDIKKTEDGQKAELVGVESTNEEQTSAPQNANTNDAAPDLETVHVKVGEKIEERPSDDHGGEELVEGQEDDVIY